MQQPGLQKPAGWPGMPGMQVPPQQIQPPPGFPAQLQVPIGFPGAPQAQQMPGFPGQMQPQQMPGFPGQMQPQQMPGFPGQMQPQQIPGFPGQVQPQQIPGFGAPMAQLHPQAAPVAPVACPPYTPPSGTGAAPAHGVPQPAQLLTRHMVEVARLLEQAIPPLQIVQSILFELAATPAARTIAGLEAARTGVLDVLFHHGALLGTIRRVLCGEMTPAVLTLLATSFHMLHHTQAQVRPLLERLVMAVPVTQRPTLTGVAQALGTVETGIHQAGAALQALVGPQAWEMARTRALAPATVPGAPTAATTAPAAGATDGTK